MLVELESKGVRLAVNAGKLVVDTDQPLTDEQRGFIRVHKSQILAELAPVARLRRLAGNYRIDQDELLSWYSQDHADIQTMDDLTLNAMVRDYACNRDTFRGIQSYENYQLWFYRLDRGKLGYMRQGLMTTDMDEALLRLESIYGSGNVFDLHIEGREV